MNISILVSLVGLVLLRVVRRPIANMATVAIIIGFIWFVGPSPSVIRAAIMGAISLVAVSLGRQNWPFLAWILAVVGMLMLNPLWIGDLSFQLSVTVTLGIILFGRKQAARGSSLLDGCATSNVAGTFDSPAAKSLPTSAAAKWIWSLLEDDLRVTMAAQVFTVSIIFFQIQRISLVSPLSNVLISWLMAPIMVLGFAVVIGGLIWLPLE